MVKVVNRYRLARWAVLLVAYMACSLVVWGVMAGLGALLDWLF